MWPVFFNVLTVLACFLSLAALFWSVRIAAAVRDLQDQLLHLPVSRMKSLETSLADTQDALTEVANRVKMMKVRSAANHIGGSSGEPDPYKDPDAWRKMVNAKLNRAKAGI